MACGLWIQIPLYFTGLPTHRGHTVLFECFPPLSYHTLYFWARGLFCKTATVTKATIAMTPITVMMMVTGVCQGFFSFISESGGGKDRETGRRGEGEGLPGVESGKWGTHWKEREKRGGVLEESCVQMCGVMSQHVCSYV